LSTIVTVAIVAVIVVLSLRKYVKMAKDGCGCGCEGCPSREKCENQKKISNKS